MSRVRVEIVSGREAYARCFDELFAKLSGIERDAMQRSFYGSHEVWLGFWDGRLLGASGCIQPTLLSDEAYLWNIITPLSREHPVVYGFGTRKILNQMLARYPILVGHCDPAIPGAKRWLEWLGATFFEPTSIGVPFEIKA